MRHFDDGSSLQPRVQVPTPQIFLKQSRNFVGAPVGDRPVAFCR